MYKKIDVVVVLESEDTSINRTFCCSTQLVFIFVCSSPILPQSKKSEGERCFVVAKLVAFESECVATLLDLLCVYTARSIVWQSHLSRVPDEAQ